MPSTGSSKSSSTILADLDQLLDPADEEAIAEVGAFVSRATAGFVPLGEIKGAQALIGNAVEEGKRLLEEEESEAFSPSEADVEAASLEAVDKMVAALRKRDPTLSQAAARASVFRRFPSVGSAMKKGKVSMPNPPGSFATATSRDVPSGAAGGAKFTDQEQVLEEVNRLASELIAQDPSGALTLAQARTAVWQKHPELVELYRTLPSGAQGSKGPAPAPHLANPPQKEVVKGHLVISKVAEKARELRKADPSLSMARAKSRIWETHPDLAAEYRRAQRTQ